MEKQLSPKLVPLIITLLGIPLLLLVIATAHLGSRLMRQTSPLQDASMMIKIELVSFRLAFERHVYIDPSSDPKDIWAHLDRAEWYAGAMLSGGRDVKWEYVPLDDPELRGEITKVIDRIKELRAFAEKRMLPSPGKRAAFELERRFAPVMITVTEQADRVEAALQELITRQQRNYLFSVFAVLGICVLLAAATVSVIYKYLTNVKKAEEEIASMRAFLQTIIDGVSERIMVIDREYNVTLVNRTSDGFLDRPGPVKCHEYSHGLEKPCGGAGWSCPLEKIIRSGRPVTIEHEHEDGEGKLRFEEISASPLKNSEGKVIGIIESMRDITERKELERQRTDFYAMVTHDLKSPLTSILGYTELMLSGQAGGCDESIREMLESVNKSGGKLFRMVDDFLALSKMESGQKLHAAPGRIADILRETAKDFEVMAAQRGIRFRMEVPESLPVIGFDRRGVQRAVSNLLLNAVSYTSSGGTVTLRAEQRAEPDRYSIEVSVADTGAGIPNEEQERIFDKYYRSPRTSGISGSGLGLAIVKAVAEAHGGMVELESEEGKGSTFRLLLPAESAVKAA